MEPPGALPPDRDKYSTTIIQQQQPNNSNLSSSSSALQVSTSIGSVSTASAQQQQPPIERLSRPAAFDKMEILVREMQDSETGVPVRSQKLFLTSIPSAFMGYDLIEWLMERLAIEESEALNIANQLCLHGYFFPVNDCKTLVVKDDSSLYRFQTPYYWPWQHKAPDNVEYAIYLAKRSLRNKQRHGLEDYESDALASLHKNLKGKWDFITMQAEEQVKLSKDRKKGDKIVGDSQERAYWRVHRPPPGQFTPLEPCPVPSRDRQGKPRRRNVDDWQREVDYLTSSLGRTRMKMSQACECLVQYWETFTDYDFFIQPVLPSNPWVSEDITFWQLNNTIVEIPTEKRVKRWAITIEELVSDPTGLQEFTTYLKKEYSHENIRFWIAVTDLRRSAHSQITRKVREIYEEFLEPGAPCEINIDGKTMEKVQVGLKCPSRFTFDAAAEHIYTLLLKKDCYPRFIRSEQYKILLATGIQPSLKKRFFGFGGVAKKKTSTSAAPNVVLLAQTQSNSSGPPPGHLTRRRGSDRSLTGSAHELAVSGVKDSSSKVPHSHSQSNLSDIPYREGSKCLSENLEATAEPGACAVCPWDTAEPIEPTVSLTVCPWENDTPSTTTAPKQTPRFRNNSAIESGSSSSDISEVAERMRRSCGLRQNTLDCELFSSKRLTPTVPEQRRASMTMAPRIMEMSLTSHLSAAFHKSDEITQFPMLLLKTASFDERDTAAASSSIPLTISEESSMDERHEIEASVTIECDSEESISTKQLKESRESLVSLRSKTDVQSIHLSLASDSSTLKESTSIHTFSTTPTINVVCPMGEENIDIDQDETNFDAMKRDDTACDDLDKDKLSLDMGKGDSDSIIPPEELSPTTEEYQECVQTEDYELDIGCGDRETLAPGCVAPAPTPAPSVAPLAEIEADPPDDDAEMELSDPLDVATEVKTVSSEVKKKRKKRDSVPKEKKEDKDGAAATSAKTPDPPNRNAVCPWEDEDVPSDATFVKTYATLGYL